MGRWVELPPLPPRPPRPLSMYFSDQQTERAGQGPVNGWI